MDVDEFAAFLNQSLVEVEQIIVFLFVERTKVVLIIFEKWTVEVAGAECLPMLVSPVTVVADAEIANESASVIGLLHGNGEGKRSGWRVDDAAVAIGLLDVAFVCFHINNTSSVGTLFCSEELGKPLNWWQICCG